MARNVWLDQGDLKVLGMGAAFPGSPISTEQLLDRLDHRFGLNLARLGRPVAQRLNIRARHICRAFADRREAPLPGCGNPDLAATAIRAALGEAGLSVGDLAYLIGHTATPAQPIPPNIARVAELLGYDGPFVELRQACTGFINALVMAKGLLGGPNAGPVAIVGSETGSVFFDPLRAATDHGQLVNLVQMGDGAGAIVLGPPDRGPAGHLGRLFHGQIGRDMTPGLTMPHGGSAASVPPWGGLEFEHDFPGIRRSGLALFTEGAKAGAALDIDLRAVDRVVPHQANGRMAALLAPHLEIPESCVFVNADRLGNTGSAAIWLALAELRGLMKAGQTALVLGAEATKYMFGGFLYTHA